MSILLLLLSSLLLISMVVLATFAVSYRTKAGQCINDPGIYCYNNWQCGDGALVKAVHDSLVQRCSRTDGSDCPCQSNWSDPIPSQGINGNYSATGAYNPAASSQVTPEALCSLWD